MKLRSWRGIVLLVAALLIAAWGALRLLHPEEGVVDWVLLKIFHPGPRHLELTASLEVRGQTINIERSIDCRPKFNSADDGSFSLSPGWSPTRYLVSERLSDDTGVMIVVPRACNREDLPAKEFVPLVLWVNSTTAPRTIEAYFDQRGLVGGRFPIRLLAFNLTRVDGEAATPTPPTDFADWSNIYSKDPSPRGHPVRYLSLAAISITPEDVPAATQAELQHLRPTDPPYVALAQTAGSGRAIAEYLSRAASGNYERSIDTAEIDRLVPFLPTQTEGYYQIAEEAPGLIVFVPDDASRCENATVYCVRWHRSDLVVDHLPAHYIAQGGQILFQFLFGFSYIPTTQN